MTDRYAVFGNPVAHSKSPVIHKLFKDQTGQDITYDKQQVELDQFAQAAKKFFDEGGKGLNITVPFKLDAYAFAEKHGSVSERAKLAGAVNTLKKMPDGKIYGDTTDGVGLIRDLRNKCLIIFPNFPQFNLIGNSVLILGAGGAVRGIIHEIIREGFREIVIANRTKATAVELAEKFSRFQSKVTGCGYLELEKESVDLIINGTSASLFGDLPPIPGELVKPTTLCYDMMYGKEDTVFMQWAKQRGSEYVFDGLGMLVEQAAESFRLWRGDKLQLDTRSVIDEVRRQL